MLAASDGIVNAQAPGVAASALLTLNNSKANNNTAGGGGGIANGVPSPAQSG